MQLNAVWLDTLSSLPQFSQSWFRRHLRAAGVGPEIRARRAEDAEDPREVSNRQLIVPAFTISYQQEGALVSSSLSTEHGHSE